MANPYTELLQKAADEYSQPRDLETLDGLLAEVAALKLLRETLTAHRNNYLLTS